MAAEMDRLEGQVEQEQRQIEALRKHATKLQTEKNTKRKKLQEMGSKVKSKNEQVSSQLL